jgi:NADH-quinone oxidoreductase subunit J
MVQVAFFVGALGALGGAVAVITLRNPFYSVLALVVHLVSLAGLFLLLHAEFVAAAQVVVYAGAVMVLYVFVAAYVGNVEDPLWDPIPGQRLLTPLVGALLFIELSIAILGSGLKAIDGGGPTVELGFGSPAEIGTLMLERFLIAFEAASLLLLLAAVGALILAGRRPAIAAGEPPTDTAPARETAPGQGGGPPSPSSTTAAGAHSPTETAPQTGTYPPTASTPTDEASGSPPADDVVGGPGGSSADTQHLRSPAEGVEGGPGGGSADTQGLRSSGSTPGEADTGGASDEPSASPPPEERR